MITLKVVGALAHINGGFQLAQDSSSASPLDTVSKVSRRVSRGRCR